MEGEDETRQAGLGWAGLDGEGESEGSQPRYLPAIPAYRYNLHDLSNLF